ncbi:MAG: (5-formylfuran-3-yl)methyl phosphate synthase [Methylococcaceae bacterium]|jgi:uncharacterized protein (UPF0264 family)
MTRVLASVANLDEACLAYSEGADIIDLKNPSAGALGALPLSVIATITAKLSGFTPLSATIGDIPMDPDAIVTAVKAVASTGVDYVKIGFFPNGDWSAVLTGLQSRVAPGTPMIAVLFADQSPSLEWLPTIAQYGFAGAMLDTADKGIGSLPQLCDLSFLADFVATCRASNLVSGLAGSLRLDDIPELLPLHPDYLGFRSALCHRDRRSALNPQALASVLLRVRTAQTPLS